MTDTEIDNELEALYRRWQKLSAVSRWQTVHDELEALKAYALACGRYDRIAPSDRARREMENATWN